MGKEKKKKHLGNGKQMELGIGWGLTDWVLRKGLFEAIYEFTCEWKAGRALWASGWRLLDSPGRVQRP